MAYKGQKFKRYTMETKLEIIRLYVEENWTYRKISDKFEIQDKDRVKKWVRKYAFFPPESMSAVGGGISTDDIVEFTTDFHSD